MNWLCKFVLWKIRVKISNMSYIRGEFLSWRPINKLNVKMWHKINKEWGRKKGIFLSPFLLKQVLMSWRKCFAFRLKSTIWNRRWIFCVVMSGQLIELSSVNIWGLIHPQVWYSIPNQWLGKKSLPKRKTEGVKLFKQLWGNLIPSKLSSFVSQIRSWIS